MNEEKGRIGSSFDGFLKEEGLYEEISAGATKRRLAHQITEAMTTHNISKSEMARRMKTSRSQLDPENTKIQLETLYKAAGAVGRELI